LSKRICIKFCLRNDFSCARTVKMTRKCFADERMSQPRIYEWYKMFEQGRECVEDLTRALVKTFHFNSHRRTHIGEIKKLV
ncbi:Putative uncharacterized protein FLJ37770, partial [Harpegnathos saltator]